jgi:hypothetical protein
VEAIRVHVLEGVQLIMCHCEECQPDRDFIVDLEERRLILLKQLDAINAERAKMLTFGPTPRASTEVGCKTKPLTVVVRG